MKRRITVFLFVFASFFTIANEYDFNPLNASVLMWTAEAQQAYNNTTSNHFYDRSILQDTQRDIDQQVVGLKYYYKTVNVWSNFRTREIIDDNDQSQEYMAIGTESCQCVGLVKELTNTPGSTHNWRKGPNIQRGTSYRDLPEIGTAIAIFGESTLSPVSLFDASGNTLYDSNGNVITRRPYRYTGSGLSNTASPHTAIIVGRDGRGQWVDVIDQNWKSVPYENYFCSSLDSTNKGFVTVHRLYFHGTGVNNLSNYSIVMLENWLHL